MHKAIEGETRRESKGDDSDVEEDLGSGSELVDEASVEGTQDDSRAIAPDDLYSVGDNQPFYFTQFPQIPPNSLGRDFLTLLPDYTGLLDTSEIENVYQHRSSTFLPSPPDATIVVSDDLHIPCHIAIVRRYHTTIFVCERARPVYLL